MCVRVCVCVFVFVCVFVCLWVCVCVRARAYLRREKLLFISNCCFDLEISATRIITNTLNDYWVFWAVSKNKMLLITYINITGKTADYVCAITSTKASARAFISSKHECFYYWGNHGEYCGYSPSTPKVSGIFEWCQGLLYPYGNQGAYHGYSPGSSQSAAAVHGIKGFVAS